ncbi:MAG: hypothetical protein KF884_10710 [Fimbriimonadaceae bacterium]|nr:hypothetical protein [Fimbriimonadaceae bacterium]QYK58017.1 MAG: hypothetical protein KF884_10710 [Fimbriimonadaceae bacterium]
MADYPREVERLELPSDVFLREGSRLRPGADLLSRGMFSSDATVDFGRGAEAVVASLFPGFDPRLVCQDLVGAPGGSSVVVDRAPGGLSISVSDRRFESCHRRLLRGGGGELWMANDELVLEGSERGQGTGLRVFARQAAACRALGIGQIAVVAARGPAHPDGYYVWALFGYTGQLDARLARAASAAFPEFAPIVAVEQLVRIPGGLDWWRVNGETWTGVFEVDGESFLTLVDRASDKRLRFDRGIDPLVADGSEIELYQSMVESFLERAPSNPAAYTPAACLERAASHRRIVEAMNGP